MPDDRQTDATRTRRRANAKLELLDTDSGRKPMWGIAAGVVLVALAFLVVSRVASDDSPPRSYTSQIAPTTEKANGDGATPVADVTNPRRGSTTSATIFFFAMVGTMVVVGTHIVWRARRIYRVTHPCLPSQPTGTLNSGENNVPPAVVN